MSDDLPTSDSVTYVPSGCLYNEEIEIPCKGPDEKVFYTFSLQRRLRQNDTIIAVRGNADDKTIKLLFVSCEDKGFTVLISGGTLGNKVAIHFFVQTSSEEERSFTASLAIMPDGIVKDKNNYNFVPLPGPEGPPGKAAMFKIGDVITGAPGTEAKVENVGTANDAKLNITIPQGIKGDKGSEILTGNADPVSIDGIVTPAFYVNNKSGDFFYLQKDGTEWEKKGNLVGPQGIQGKSGTIQINSVTASEPDSNPSITNVGTDNEAKWNVVLPRGKQGPAGIDGTTYLKGKNISFIGDSITTFAGYIAKGNPSFYPQYLINDVNQTWWMQLVKKTGATLLTNDAYSGSYLSNFGNGSLQTRFKVIDPRTDICLVLMGANDLINNIELGDFKTPASFSSTNNGFNTYTILGALCNAIVNLQNNYRNTKFVWITPLKQFNSTGDSNPRTMPGRQARFANGTYTEKTNPKYQYYTLIDQSRWQRKYVKNIQIYTLTEPNINVADISVLLITDPNTPDMKVKRVRSFRIMTGVYYYLGWYVEPGEYIAVHSNNKAMFPGTWSYSTTAKGGSYYYFDPDKNQWATAEDDLNIGIDDGPPGTTTNTLAEKMIKVFEYYGVDYIDSRSLGITSMNQNYYLADGTHPLPAGATLFANFVNNRLYGIF